MPFILKRFSAPKGKKIQLFLLQDLGYKPAVAHRLISRGRVFDSKHNSYLISQSINEDEVYIGLFEGHTRGLKPLLTFNEFAIFDKPSNLVIHPNSKKTEYSLLDEIRYHFGESANQAHRIDAETSGLVLVGKHEKATNILASMFETKEYKKSYLALVEGKIDKEITIDKNLKREGKAIGVRMATCPEDEGKHSVTHVKPISYNEKKDITLLELIPITGRQHQIRIHLHSIGHRIIGDPIYGVEDEYAEDYLNKTLDEKKRVEVTGSYRLWLHANYLEFKFEKNIYKIFSKNQEIFKEFEKEEKV